MGGRYDEPGTESGFAADLASLSSELNPRGSAVENLWVWSSSLVRGSGSSLLASLVE